MKGNEIQEIQHIPFFSTTKLYTWGFVLHAAQIEKNSSQAVTEESGVSFHVLQR